MGSFFYMSMARFHVFQRKNNKGDLQFVLQAFFKLSCFFLCVWGGGGVNFRWYYGRKFRFMRRVSRAVKSNLLL